ncbi:MAG: DUF4232 domain-containing protein [Bryobacteraceae bacterium]
MRSQLLTLACVLILLSWLSAVCQAADCTSAQLKTSAKALAGGMSHAGYALSVTNTSAEPCRLAGVPATRFIGDGEMPQQVPICANCTDYLFLQRPAHPVIVRPSASAYFLVGITEGGEDCRKSLSIEVVLSTGSPTLNFHDDDWTSEGFSSCGKVNVSAWRAGKKK